MPMNLPFPTVWSLIENFKDRCRSSGWETCETEDLIRTEDGEYHSFLWTQTIHPSTFERIATNHKCGIRRGNTYEVVNVAHIAWLFQERPPDFLFSLINENPELRKKTALFDLSLVYSGENVCRKFNETESMVFKEFEQFLEEEWDIEFQPVDELPAITT
jgi:hypothetical protein